MIDIEDTIVSQDVTSCYFTCDLSFCKGACCVQGDSGAPLDDKEANILKEIFPEITPYLRQKGIDAILSLGTSTVDNENDTVTPLIDDKECAYAIFENGIARCGIEKAFLAGAISFRKPSSCHLYPIRIRKYKTFDAVNYDRWEICQPAIENGLKIQMPLYRFSAEALINKYGQHWYNQLVMIAEKTDEEVL